VRGVSSTDPTRSSWVVQTTLVGVYSLSQGVTSIAPFTFFQLCCIGILMASPTRDVLEWNAWVRSLSLGLKTEIRQSIEQRGRDCALSQVQ